MNNIELLRYINTLTEKGIPFVLSTIIKATSGSPGRVGFKMVYLENGETKGTVGGGELEFQVIEKSKEIIKTGESDILNFNLKSDLEMACGGKVEIFLEYYQPKRRAFLFGAGHMGKALSPILSGIGFETIVIDNREDYAKKDLIPSASEVINIDYIDYVETFEPHKDDTIVIFTYGHHYDYKIFKKLCERDIDVSYLGIIGSRKKIGDMIKKIKDELGDNQKLIDQLYAPIGLNIAKRESSEIALSIGAEILAHYNGVKEINYMKNIKKLPK